MARICLGRLRSQSHSPDLVVVADNASTDGTAAALAEVARSWDRLLVIPMPGNEGNGAGVKAAMGRALAEGADWVWVLDDDSWPEPGALGELLARADDPGKAYASLVVAPGGRDLAWPLVIREPGGAERIAVSAEDFAGSPAAVIRGGWLGGLVSREIVGRVGLPEPSFFLRGEDEDYNSRFLEAGIETLCVRGSLLVHPKPEIRRVSLFGKHLFYEPGLAPWKTYYTIRNRAWLRIRYAPTKARGLAKAFGYIGLNALLALALDDRKVERLGAILAGGRDALAGRLGKTVEPC
jgi:GT2 family glycosyltransferase